MKKLTLVLGAAVVMIGLATLGIAQSPGGDGEKAEGIARGALSDCISDARAAGNDILTFSIAGAGEGDWDVIFCSKRKDIEFEAQRVGDVVLESWDVLESNCEFPAPTNNPCF